jgi:hypothetical protein
MEDFMPYSGEYSLPDMTPRAQDRVWVKNYTKPVGSLEPNEDHLAHALSLLEGVLSRHYRRFQYRVWEHDEVMDDFDPDSMAGSPGFPLNRFYQRKRDIPKEQLIKLTSCLESALYEGKYPCISQLFAKAELVKHSKIESDDQRDICANPVEHTYLCKKYWGEWWSWLKSPSHNHPWQQGLNIRSLSWTRLAYHLTRDGYIQRFVVVDVAGMEKRYNGVYLKGIRRILLNFIPPQHKRICEQLLCCLDQLTIRAPNGILTKLWNFNGSGHPFTTIFNNFVMFCFIVIGVVMCTGKVFQDLEELLEMCIYGDDGVLGVTEELHEMGFRPAKFRAALQSLDIVIKCSDDYLEFKDVDFLSMKWVQFRDSIYYGPSPIRMDKLKLSLLTRHKKMTIPQHFMKIAQIRFQVCFSDELWGYCEAVCTMFEDKYRQFNSTDRDWLAATRMLYSREICQLRTLGITLDSRRSEGLKHEMAKTSQKKIMKKVERKVERKVAKKHTKKRTAVNHQHQSPASGVPRQPMTVTNVSRVPKTNIAMHTKEYAAAVLEPWWALAEGVFPTYPDNNEVSAHRFGTKTVVAFESKLQVGSTNYWTAVEAQAYPFNSIVGIYANGDDPSPTFEYPCAGYDATWALNFASIRCVAMGYKIRNTSAVMVEQGTCLHYRVPQSGAFCYEMGTLGLAAKQIGIQSSGYSFARSLADPGKVGHLTWLPNSMVAAGDTQFKPPDADPFNDADFGGVEGRANRTTIGMLITHGGTQPQSFVYELYQLWEAIPTAAKSPLFPPVLKMGDMEMAQALLMRRMQAIPDLTEARCVSPDDGFWESLFSDVKDIFGGVRGVFESGGKALGGLLSAGSAIGGLFSELPPRQASARYVAALFHMPDGARALEEALGVVRQIEAGCGRPVSQWTNADFRVLRYALEGKHLPKPPAIDIKVDAAEIVREAYESEVKTPSSIKSFVSVRR